MADLQRDLERLAELRATAFAALDAVDAASPRPPDPECSQAEQQRYWSDLRALNALHPAAIAATTEYLNPWKRLRDELGDDEIKRLC